MQDPKAFLAFVNQHFGTSTDVRASSRLHYRGPDFRRRAAPRARTASKRLRSASQLSIRLKRKRYPRSTERLLEHIVVLLPASGAKKTMRVKKEDVGELGRDEPQLSWKEPLRLPKQPLQHGLGITP